MVEIDQVFTILKIGPSFGKSEAAYPLVPYRAIGIDAPDRDKLILADLPIHAAAQFRISPWCGNGLANFSSESNRHHRGLRVFLFTIRRNEKRGSVALAYRTGQAAFKDAALL